MRRLRLPSRIFGLRRSLRRHRRDDGALALEDAVVDVGGVDLLLDLADAGQHAHHARHAAELLHLLAADRRGPRGRSRPCASSRRSPAPSRCRWSARPSRPGSRRRPCRGCGRRCAAGWKSSSASHFSPTPSSLIGLPVTARMESAAPPRPSPSTRVSTMPVMPTRSLKLLRQLDGVLAGQAVGDQQRLVRVRDVAHLGRLAHQLFVDVDAAGGIEQHDVVAAEPAPHRCARLAICCGVWPATIGSVSTLGLLAQHAQLLLRRRTARVERGHQHFLLVAVGEPVARSWRVVVVLPEPCRPTIMMATGGWAARSIGSASEPSMATSSSLHDLDDHLAGRDRLDHVLADGLGLHLVDEVAHHLERHVRLEQRAAHLAHGLATSLSVSDAAPGQLVEDAGQAI